MAAQLKRFAEYEDLKKLHTLVIPEISKFETKLSDYDRKLQGIDLIIRNFDEIIQTKSNKVTIEELHNEINTIQSRCVDRAEIGTFLDEQALLEK